MIKSYELEKKVLSGILQHPEKWGEISSFISEEDFYSEDSKVNISIFKMLRNALHSAEHIDETILIQRIGQLGVSFPDSIDIGEYIHSLAFFSIPEDIFLQSIKELKKFTIRRKIYNSAADIARFVKKPDPSISASSIIDKSDELHNEAIQSFQLAESGVTNLADLMEDLVEDRGNNPVTEFGMMGPHPITNKIFGSFYRPGNITCVVARAKAGKTSYTIDHALKTAFKYNVPILHFDNGEMSEEELVFRLVAAMSGVPMHLLETGKWRTHSYKDFSSEQIVERVRSVWPRVKNLKIFYENVAGQTPEEMSALLKRVYYTKVGRGNNLIFSFDYLKTDFANLGRGDSWAFVGKCVDKFKQTISRELKFDGNPVVSMITSVQSNRLGITNNRQSADLVEDESVVGLSDNIIQFVSHLFLLRQKTLDEITEEGVQFGTHKFIPLVARHLGEDPFGFLHPVEMPDGTKRKNFINLEFNNFNVTECGDLNSINEAFATPEVALEEPEEEELPI